MATMPQFQHNFGVPRSLDTYALSSNLPHTWAVGVSPDASVTRATDTTAKKVGAKLTIAASGSDALIRTGVQRRPTAAAVGNETVDWKNYRCKTWSRLVNGADDAYNVRGPLVMRDGPNNNVVVTEVNVTAANTATLQVRIPTSSSMDTSGLGPFDPQSEFTVEVEYRAASSGQSDGVIKTWLNGTLVLNEAHDSESTLNTPGPAWWRASGRTGDLTGWCYRFAGCLPELLDAFDGIDEIDDIMESRYPLLGLLLDSNPHKQGIVMWSHTDEANSDWTGQTDVVYQVRYGPAATFDPDTKYFASPEIPYDSSVDGVAQVILDQTPGQEYKARVRMYRTSDRSTFVEGAELHWTAPQIDIVEDEYILPLHCGDDGDMSGDVWNQVKNLMDQTNSRRRCWWTDDFGYQDGAGNAATSLTETLATSRDSVRYFMEMPGIAYLMRRCPVRPIRGDHQWGDNSYEASWLAGVVDGHNETGAGGNDRAQSAPSPYTITKGAVAEFKQQAWYQIFAGAYLDRAKGGDELSYVDYGRTAQGDTLAIYMIDGRQFSDVNGDEPTSDGNPTPFGETQEQWLLNALENETCPNVLLMSGNVLHPATGNFDDPWTFAQAKVQAIADAIDANAKIKHALVASGDRHIVILYDHQNHGLLSNKLTRELTVGAFSKGLFASGDSSDPGLLEYQTLGGTNTGDWIRAAPVLTLKPNAQRIEYEAFGWGDVAEFATDPQSLFTGSVPFAITGSAENQLAGVRNR